MSNTTVTKTYNMGRVVGWSTYEEFLKENPNIDSSVITPMVYSTMVTYGVTRVVTIPAESNKWQPVQGTDTVFYTATVEVPGATFGAVPIVGVNYNYYVNTFKGNNHRYAEATEQAGTNKELLEKAFRCIFTCYVSDVNGTRAESSSANSGYLTFAAYPDIIDYLESVSALVPADGLKVIVRGLSLSGLTDVNDLYFGPQGLVVTNGGSDDAKYCEQETVDISALCLNASGYIWMSIGGNTGSSYKALFTSLTGHPHGEVLISTFGYLNPEMIDGTGTFENLGHYAYTYAQYKDIKNTPNFHIIDTQVAALEHVSADEPEKYMYLIAGQSRYEAPPPDARPLFAIPVRKSDYFVNVGDFGVMQTPVLKKKFDLTHTYNTGGDRCIIIPNQVLPNYIGSYWRADDVPSECKLGYGDTIGSNYWINHDIYGYDDVLPSMNGRVTYFKIKDAAFPGSKGDFIILYDQPTAQFTGLYQCVMDESEDTSAYHTFIRRGAYVAMDTPSWVTSKTGNFCWKVDLSGKPVTVTDDVLKINGVPIYPGELIVLGTSTTHRQYFILNTITNGAAELIVSTECEFSIDIDSTMTSIAGIVGTVENGADIVLVDDLTLEDIITATSVDVYTDATNQYSFTLTNIEFTTGLLFNLRHQKQDVYGYDKWYRYIYIGELHGLPAFASGEVWTSNSNLSNVAGYPGRWNSAFPCYGQTLPTADGSWHYNAPAALAHTPAKKLFQDLGYDIADYVHEDFQNLSLGRFLQECVIRKDLSVAPSESTMRSAGIESTFHLYAQEDLNYTSGNVPAPTASSPIEASMTLQASTSAKSYFSTAYYTAELKNGTPVNINNPDYPIWASISKTPEGMETMSVSVTDNSGSQLDFSGNSGTIEADTITWLDLLVGLGSGKSVDVLKGARFGKGNNNCNYIETADGTRLYISTTEPTGDIPDGSIGIGW